MTGASGFLGRGLVAYFSQLGIETHALVRDPASVAAAPGVTVRSYRLEDDLDPAALRGIDAVVHCAFIRHGPHAKDSSQRNVRGTLSLRKAARAAGARFVFISTASAIPEARSEYGRHKLAIERALADTDALVLRPGLIVGNGGLLRSLHDAVRCGIVPLIDGGRQSVQVTTPDEIGRAIALAAAAGLRGTHVAASASATTVRHIARSLALRTPRRVRFISVPWPLAFAAALAVERVGLTLPVTTENLWGMRAASTEPPSPALLERGWSALPWNERCEKLRFDGDEHT